MLIVHPWATQYSDAGLAICATSPVHSSAGVSDFTFEDLYIINITQPLISWIVGVVLVKIPASFKALR
jgi:hypothetical protein